MHGADLYAAVATEQSVSTFGGRHGVDVTWVAPFSAMFDGEITQAVMAVDGAIFAESPVGAGSAACSAMQAALFYGVVGDHIESCHHLGKDHLSPDSGDDDIAIIASDADAGTLCPISLEDGCRIDTDAPIFILYARHERGDGMTYTRLDEDMIIGEEGVSRDAGEPRVAPPWGGVRESHRDDGAGTPLQEQARVEAYGAMICHILHAGVVTPGEPGVEASAGDIIDRSGCSHPDGQSAGIAQSGYYFLLKSAGISPHLSVSHFLIFTVMRWVLSHERARSTS